MAKTAKPKFDLKDLKAYRLQQNLNQQDFWKPLGVTQSGGSRYEGDRNIPLPVAMLLILRETGKVSAKDLEAAMVLVKKAQTAKKA